MAMWRRVGGVTMMTGMPPPLNKTSRIDVYHGINQSDIVSP